MAEVGNPNEESLKLAKNVHEHIGGMYNDLARAVLWNSSARIEKNDFSDPAYTEEYVTKGNVTEQGLIKFFMAIEGGEGCLGIKH
jgi:hypothetical protein